MSERDTYPHGVPNWVEALVPDPERATAFYGEVFGWDFGEPGKMPGEGSSEYFVARVRGRDVAGIGSLPQDVPAAVWTTEVRTDSAAATAAAVAEAGGTVVRDPFDVPPVGRMAVAADTSGAHFVGWEADGREGAQLVNEPGAWAMSTLFTPDPDAAKRFYGSVFGWTTESFGDGSVTIFRLPGFVGGEPQQPVPRDVVATMVDTGEGGTPAHWRPDFWVDDIDRVAATAERLGGEVIAPPAEVPGLPMRSGLLADRDGATFSVTQLLLGGAG